jgi:hypothetical protein
MSTLGVRCSAAELRTVRSTIFICEALHRDDTNEVRISMTILRYYSMVLDDVGYLPSQFRVLSTQNQESKLPQLRALQSWTSGNVVSFSVSQSSSLRCQKLAQNCTA